MFNFKDTEFQGHLLKKDKINNILYLITKYVEISSKTFKKIDRNYRVYIDYLISIGLIRCNESYSNYENNNFSKKYYVNTDSDYYLDELKYETNKKRIIQNITNKKQTKKDINMLKINDKILNRLKKDFDSIEANNNNYIKYKDCKKWISSNEELDKLICKENRTFSFTSKRLYTTFTNLPSLIRKRCIKLDGKTIQEYDMKSSFIKFLCVYARENNLEIEKEFILKLKHNDIYECIMDDINNIENKNIERNTIKRLFLSYINKPKNWKYDDEDKIGCFIGDYLLNKYPLLHSVINNCNNMYDELVERETKFMFNAIEDIYKKVKNVKILTCHDAIYVQSDLSSQVGVVWKENTDILDIMIYDNNKKTRDIVLKENIDLYECNDIIIDLLKNKKIKEYDKYKVSKSSEEDDDTYYIRPNIKKNCNYFITLFFNSKYNKNIIRYNYYGASKYFIEKSFEQYFLDIRLKKLNSI